MPLFYELTALFVLAGIMGLVASKLRQPPLVGYLLAGIIAGTDGLGLINSTDELELFSKIGIVFLLFAVGLHLNPGVLKETGKSAFFAGGGQVAFTTFFGFLLLSLLGFTTTSAIYVAIALTFSSTIVAVKIFTDKKDLNKLYAKISIGILLVQDIVAAIVLLGISLSNGTSGNDPVMTIAYMIGKVCLLAIVLVVGHGWIMPKLLKISAHSGEVLFLFTVGWGLAVAGLFLALDLSMEIGALLAGVALSTSPYVEEIGSRLKPVRDLFLVLFFIVLGSHIDLAMLPRVLPIAILLSLFVLIGNPFIMWMVLKLQGHTNKVGLMTGLVMAQISEFSLILVSIGISMGKLTSFESSLVAVVALITISVSSYMMFYNEQIFEILRPFMNKISKTNKVEISEKLQNKYTALLFGYDRVGKDFVDVYKKLGMNFFVVDFNPETIARLKDENLDALYGDAGDVEFLEMLPTSNANLAVSTIPDIRTSILLCKFLLSVRPKLSYVGTAHTKDDAEKLYKAGAAYVIMPHYLGAKHAVRIIKKAKVSTRSYLILRKRHMARLGIV